MDPEALKPVIDALKQGRAVIFPTDTVCGVGVAVRYAENPQEIFKLKRRPADKPVAWLVGGMEDLRRYGVNVSSQAFRLAEEGWPGALTLVVRASVEVPPAFQSAQGTIGLRMPASETALALIRAVGPLATSSANWAGEAPSRSIDQVDAELLHEAAAYMRSNESGGGTASRVIDATGSKLLVLR